MAVRFRALALGYFPFEPSIRQSQGGVRARLRRGFDGRNVQADWHTVHLHRARILEEPEVNNPAQARESDLLQTRSGTARDPIDPGTASLCVASPGL